MVILTVPIVLGLIRAQDVADWQTRAGGSMSFEVGSIKQDKGAGKNGMGRLTSTTHENILSSTFHSTSTPPSATILLPPTLQQ